MHRLQRGTGMNGDRFGGLPVPTQAQTTRNCRYCRERLVELKAGTAVTRGKDFLKVSIVLVCPRCDAPSVVG